MDTWIEVVNLTPIITAYSAIPEVVAIYSKIDDMDVARVRVLTSPRTYDDALMDRLLDVEMTLCMIGQAHFEYFPSIVPPQPCEGFCSAWERDDGRD